ncbi:hypothetical protein ACOSQ3_031052 [Xanthoceras sorbifolium]
MRRGAGLAGVRSLSVLGAGRWVLNTSGCDGGLCVGEGRVLVATVGGVVLDPGSDRAAGAVLLGPDSSSGGLSDGERGVLEPALGSDLSSFSRGLGAAVGYFFCWLCCCFWRAAYR